MLGQVMEVTAGKKFISIYRFHCFETRLCVKSQSLNRGWNSGVPAYSGYSGAGYSGWNRGVGYPGYSAGWAGANRGFGG